MPSNNELIEAIRKAAGTSGVSQVYIVACYVESVNEANRTCSCSSITDGEEKSFPDVALMANVDDGFVLVPAADSEVIIMYSKDVPPVVISYGEIQAAEIVVGNTGLRIEDGSIKANDGSFGGLIKIGELISDLKQNNELIQALLDVISNPVPITEPGNGAPSALQAALSAAITGMSLAGFDRGVLENDKITHGANLG